MIRTLRVKLVSRMGLGGADGSGFDDPPVFRPPAIRGVLRFWTRALAGPDPRTLENQLWGSADGGQGISILAPERCTAQPASFALLPHQSDHRKAFARLLDPAAQKEALKIRFRFPRHLAADHDAQRRLKAIVWTWLHLGTIGRRSRRGYGSLLWHGGDLLEGLEVGNPPEEWDNTSGLSDYLRNGLAWVEQVLSLPSSSAPRRAAGWFRLESTDQVFVGSVQNHRFDGTKTGMEFRIHGLNEGSRGGSYSDRAQMGRARPRLASPMMWRLFRAKDGGWIPVMTWSPTDGVTRIPLKSDMYKYLKGTLGFDFSLANKTPLGL